ncbi:MAG: sulfite exporter TauE/SafE family protein [Steroidobacteraceae bacterium]
MALLLAAGLAAGAMNAMAGGGSFVSLPALIGAGLPSVVANASSTIALYPGGIASAWVYRGGLSQVCGVPLRPTLIATLVGGFIGAVLLLVTPTSMFDRVLPWLLFVATLALAFGPRLGPAIRERFRAGIGTVLLIQFLLGMYGGYFGGAVGLMMVAAWSLLEEANLKALSAPRTLLVSAANTVAVLCFVIAGAVRWPETLLLGAGAMVGGYGGAAVGKKLPPDLVRSATVLLAAAMTLRFFIRAYG